MGVNLIERVKLLMEYDSSLTLKENLNSISKKNEIISEQWGSLLKKSAGAFTGTFDDILQGVVGKTIKNTNGKVITSLDDLAINLEKKLITPQTLGQIRRSLLKSRRITPQLQTELIEDLLSNPKVLRAGPAKETDLVNAYKKLGYSDDVASEIAKKVVTKRKQLGIGSSKPKPNTKTKGNPSPAVIAKAKEFFRTSNWEAYKLWGKRLAIPVGLLALAWYMASGEDVSDPEVDNDNSGGGGGGGSSSTGYRDCNSLDFLSQGCKSNKVKELQTCIGFKGKDIDGIWGPKTQERMRQLGLHTGVLVADIESICKTYNELNKTKETQQTNQRQTQDSQSINYFPGDNPYASYDGESVSSNVSSEITGSEGPTANY